MTDIDTLIQNKLDRIADSHRIERGKTALIVVDMQHGFLDEGASLQVPKGRDVIGNIKALIDASRAAGVPVIFTEFVYHEAVPCLRGEPFGPEHLAATDGEPTGHGYRSGNCLIGDHENLYRQQGIESAKTIDELAPLPGELVVQGHTYDKFYGTHLDLALRSQGIDRIMVTGVTSDVCVNATIFSAATRNYRVIAISDGMATIHDHIHSAVLDIWRNKFARVISTKTALGEIG